MEIYFDPLHDGVSRVKLLKFAGDDMDIVDSARVSYGREGRRDLPKDEALLKFLLENEHMSPFEHNMLRFFIRAPLFVVQEMLRHRIGVSYNQYSHRYAQAGAGADVINAFYVPRDFRSQDEVNKQGSGDPVENQILARSLYLGAMQNSFKRYQELLFAGVAREQARGILPHGTYTRLYVTYNLRSLLHFLHLRHSTSAQWEIRQYAHCMMRAVKDIFPITFRNLPEGLIDLSCVDPEEHKEEIDP